MEGPKNINDWKQLDTKHVHVVFRMETIWSFRFKFIGVCVSSIEQLRMEISHERRIVYLSVCLSHLACVRWGFFST